MAADLRFVAHSTHRDAIERAIDGRRDGFAEGGFTGARRPDEAKNGTVWIAAAQLTHGEIFGDSLFRFLETVVAAVEQLLDFLQLDDLVAGRLLVPGQREHPIEISADNLILARGRRQIAHALDLTPSLLCRFLGKVRLFQFF